MTILASFTRIDNLFAALAYVIVGMGTHAGYEESTCYKLAKYS